MSSVKEIWEKTLSVLESRLARPIYEIIANRVEPCSLSDTEDTFTIFAYGDFANDYAIEKKDIIEEVLRVVSGKPIVLDVIYAEPPASRHEGSSGTVNKVPPPPPAVTKPASSQPPAAVESMSPSGVGQRKPRSLNSMYTFDTFVVGPTNSICYSSARHVAESPGQSFNPLYIYGGVGLGKTHLMHAIGHYVSDNRPNLIVECVTTESFVNEVIQSIRNNCYHEFKERYLKYDVLLMDDLQFLESKERCQEEMFHLFNSYKDDRKQIVVTCDRMPQEIPTLHERLVSRLNSGMVVDIKPPDFETRMAILIRKFTYSSFGEGSSSYPESVLEYIASKITTNIRDLEGTLTRVMAHASFSGKEITLELTEQIIAETAVAKNDLSSANISSIIKAVCKHFNVDETEVRGKRRSKDIVLPRSIAMFLAREITGLSLESIGKEFGGKDHTTVIYSCDKIENELKTDTQLARVLDKIKSSIAS